MERISAIKLNCMDAINDYLGLQTKTDNIVIEDFSVCGEHEDILVSVCFSIKHCDNVEYEYNLLTGDFTIISKRYDARMLVF